MQMGIQYEVKICSLLSLIVIYHVFYSLICKCILGISFNYATVHAMAGLHNVTQKGIDTYYKEINFNNIVSRKNCGLCLQAVSILKGV